MQHHPTPAMPPPPGSRTTSGHHPHHSHPSAHFAALRAPRRPRHLALRDVERPRTSTLPHDKARAKERRVRRLLNFCEVLFLQETHGGDAALRAALHRYRSTHTDWHSSAADPSTGGVCIFVATEVVASATPQHLIIIPGRAHTLLLRFCGGAGLAPCNIHNEKATP